MRFANPITSLFKKIRLWRKSKRLAKFRRLPRVFVPTPSKWQIVIPYKPIGVLLILILAGLCIYLVFRSDLLLVRKVEVKSINDGKGVKGFVNVEEVQGAVSQYLAKSIVFLDTKKIAENLKSQFLPIAETLIEKQLPDKLVVRVLEREPVAVLIIPEEKSIKGVKEKYLVDETGFVFARCPRGINLPELQMEDLQPQKTLKENENTEKLNLGDTVGGDLITTALDIIDGFGQIKDLEATTVSIQNQNEIRVETNKDFFVIFTLLDSEHQTGKKKINEQILLLSQIYENAKRQGKALKKVDLRFKLPVVEYWYVQRTYYFRH